MKVPRDTYSAAACFKGFEIPSKFRLKPGDRHDRNRFYHCDCREGGYLGEGNGDGHNPDMFYHCSCIEDGYILPCARCKELEDQISQLTAKPLGHRKGKE